MELSGTKKHLYLTETKISKKKFEFMYSKKNLDFLYTFQKNLSFQTYFIHLKNMVIFTRSKKTSYVFVWKEQKIILHF